MTAVRIDAEAQIGPFSADTAAYADTAACAERAGGSQRGRRGPAPTITAEQTAERAPSLVEQEGQSASPNRFPRNGWDFQ